MGWFSRLVDIFTSNPDPALAVQPKSPVLRGDVGVRVGDQPPGALMSLRTAGEVKAGLERYYLSMAELLRQRGREFIPPVISIVSANEFVPTGFRPNGRYRGDRLVDFWDIAGLPVGPATTAIMTRHIPSKESR